MADTLTRYRKELNSLDEQIVGLLAKRIDICRSVAYHKCDNGIAMMQPSRVEEVKGRCAQVGFSRYGGRLAGRYRDSQHQSHVCA